MREDFDFDIVKFPSLDCDEVKSGVSWFSLKMRPLLCLFCASEMTQDAAHIVFVWVEA